MGILSRILDIHPHASIVVHLWWLVKLKLGIFTADYSPFVSLILPCLNLREYNATRTSAFLAYIRIKNICHLDSTSLK